MFTDMGDGVTRLSLGHGKSIMACTMTFKKGCRVEPHNHDKHEQFMMVLKGSFELSSGDEKRVMKAGDCYYAIPGEIHGTYCLEDDSVLLDIHSPLRMDILEDPKSVVLE